MRAHKTQPSHSHIVRLKSVMGSRLNSHITYYISFQRKQYTLIGPSQLCATLLNYSCCKHAHPHLHSEQCASVLVLSLCKHCHTTQGHWEKPPYDNSSMRSAYHVRELDVYRLLQIHRHLDVFLSHDWPRGIAHHGNKAQLFRAKPFLQREVIAASLRR